MPDAERPRNVLLAFNTVERLFRGDFFHCVAIDDVVGDLAALPPDWVLIGLGTTNWQERHGELFVDGTAGRPRFLWADPEGDPPTALVDADPSNPLPFVAVAACDPLGGRYEWLLEDGDDVHGRVAQRCQAENIGLAAVRVSGQLRDVAYQVMCHIPIGGVAADRAPVARQERRIGEEWEALGLYAANPTIQAVVSHGVAPVHVHGRAGRPMQGGHVNRATASGATRVEVWPIYELRVRIRDLDVAVR